MMPRLLLRLVAVVMVDGGVMSFVALFRPQTLLNRCWASVGLGSMVLDLIILRIFFDMTLVFLFLRKTKDLEEKWSHLSFIQLVFALVKGVGRALGARSACSDNGLWFDGACLAFSVLAYAAPMLILIPEEKQREFSIDSESPYVALLEAGERTEKKEEEAPPKGSAWRGVLKVARPEAPMFWCAMVCAVIAALCTSAVSLWTGDALDALVAHGSGEKFKKLIAQLAIIASIGAVCTGCRGGLFSVIGVNINARVRDDLFRHVLRFELGFFDTTPTGDLTSRLSSDTAKIGDQVSFNVNVFSRTSVQLLTTVAFMFHTSSELTFIACASIPVVGFFTKRYGAFVYDLSKRMQDRLAESMKVAEEVLSSMLTVRSCAGERSVAQDFHKALLKYIEVGMQEAYAYAAWNTFNSGLPNLMTCLLLYYGGRLADKGSLRSGRLVAFMLLTQSLANSFATLADMYSDLADAMGAASKVFELLERIPDSSFAAPLDPFDEDNAVIAEDKKIREGSRIDVENVFFQYPSRPNVKVLKGISFTVEPGNVVAFTGPSGSGKSSILALVQRFYAPDSGSVKIDGQDVKNFKHSALHRVVALVGQEPVLFARSIERNVKYGLEDTIYEPNDSAIDDALKMAHALDFIEQLPEKKKTDVGERGVTMSGGQKQRIAIARALARQPRILLLDEATSALDTESERNVQAALDDLIAETNMTVLVVAHRLSTIKNADSICCMKDGNIVEQGSHSDLMANTDGVYRDLVNRQRLKKPSSSKGSKADLTAIESDTSDDDDDDDTMTTPRP